MAPALYLQIKQHILDGIRERHYQAGDRIPTEAALCEQFAVSRMTVNKALRELVAEGWLVRTAGSGSFVADRRTESPLLAIRNIADEIAERGSEYSARVIRLQRQAADEKVAVRLGLRVGRPPFTASSSIRPMGSRCNWRSASSMPSDCPAMASRISPSRRQTAI